jgi:hypothetical protein
VLLGQAGGGGSSGLPSSCGNATTRPSESATIARVHTPAFIGEQSEQYVSSSDSRCSARTSSACSDVLKNGWSSEKDLWLTRHADSKSNHHTPHQA